MLYSVFFYSLVVGYIVFAFSHALEYIAFVNIFVNSKYKKRQDSGSLFGMNLDENAFTICIVGSSFLHFIYDGLIWKVRKPEVGKPLDIKYAASA